MTIEKYIFLNIPTQCFLIIPGIAVFEILKIAFNKYGMEHHLWPRYHHTMHISRSIRSGIQWQLLFIIKDVRQTYKTYV